MMPRAAAVALQWWTDAVRSWWAEGDKTEGQNSQDLVAAAAKSLQSCLTLCDPTDGSPPGSPVPGILQARTLEWVAIPFSNAWKWKLSRSVMFDSSWPHRLQPTRLLCPWDFPGKSVGVGCHSFSGQDLEGMTNLLDEPRMDNLYASCLVSNEGSLRFSHCWLSFLLLAARNISKWYTDI